MAPILTMLHNFNTWWPRQNGSHFADDIFQYTFLYENRFILITMLLEFVRNGYNKPALVQITGTEHGTNHYFELELELELIYFT